MENKLTIKNQSLAIQQENELLIVARNSIKHKPKLAVIVESKKIRDYSLEEQKKGNKNILDYLVMLLGISTTADSDKELHYIALDMFIQEEYGNYTYEEIKEAFKMAIKGVFEGYKVIHKLDAKIFAEVIKLYTIEKNRRLRIYDNQVKKKLWELKQEMNKPTKEQIEKTLIDAIVDAYEFYKEHKRIEVGRVYLYNWLFEIRLMSRDKTVNDAVIKFAKKRLENKQKTALTKKERLLYQITNTKGEFTQTLKNTCKEISLERYFDKFTNKEQLLNSIKNKNE